MCAGAIIHSRIDNVYIGTVDEKTGAIISKANVFDTYIVNHKVNYEIGILKEDCSNILKTFFRQLRKKKKGEC